MFIKAVRILGGEGVSNKRGGIDDVVPTQHRLFEVDEINFRKVKVNKKEELPTVIPNGQILFSIPSEFPFEFFVITTKKALDSNTVRCETFIAPSCSLYIMNNEGKTIDSITCR